jgi:hypothetical protein
MEQCQCPDDSMDHKPSACPRWGRYEVIRNGQALAVCGDCKLSSDKVVTDHICGRCGRESFGPLHKISGPLDPDTGYADSEEVCDACIDQMELDSQFQRS